MSGAHWPEASVVMFGFLWVLRSIRLGEDINRLAGKDDCPSPLYVPLNPICLRDENVGKHLDGVKVAVPYGM